MSEDSRTPRRTRRIEVRDEPTLVRTLALSDAVYRQARANLARELGEGDPEQVSIKLVMQQARVRYLDQVTKGLNSLGFAKREIDSVRPRRMGEETYREFESCAEKLDVPTIALIRAALALLANEST